MAYRNNNNYSNNYNSNYNNNNYQRNNYQRNGQRNNGQNDEFYFDIKEHIGVIGTRDKGWTKEVNVVEWSGKPPKLDIRDWDPDHERMSRGITMTEEEAEKMAVLLCERYGIGKVLVKESHAQDFPEEEPDVIPEGATEIHHVQADAAYA